MSKMSIRSDDDTDDDELHKIHIRFSDMSKNNDAATDGDDEAFDSSGLPVIAMPDNTEFSSHA